MCGAGAELLLDVSSPNSEWTHAELGFGVSYLRGFSATNDSVDLRGAIRSFPTVSGYLGITKWDWVAPYVGLSFGLADLFNGQIYGPDSIQVSVKGSTFDYGPTVGLELGHDDWNSILVLEFGYRYRRFPSLEYSAKGNDTIRLFPRQLDAGGLYFSVGGAVQLKREAKEPEYAGTWLLSKVDGQDLPAVRQQPPGPALTRTEIEGGTLDLLANRCYSLAVVLKQVTYDAADRPVRSDFTTSPPTETGRWWVDDKNRLYLQPNADCKSTALDINGSYSTMLSGTELAVRHRMLARDLTFKKKP